MKVVEYGDGMLRQQMIRGSAIDERIYIHCSRI